MKSKPLQDERDFQARIVRTIRLERNPEAAIEELSDHYRVKKPDLRMGLPKGERRALGCYVRKDNTIYISSQQYLYDPYVIIHEFYHHLRNVSGKHRGTERHAEQFALGFLRSEQTGP